MTALPQNTSLGKLELIEVFEYYDRPVLFACQNASGNIFLVVLEQDMLNYEVWLYAPVSKTRFEHVRSGAIDLYTAFAEAEDGLLFEVTVSNKGREASAIPLLTSTVGEERLPMRGEYLNLETSTLPELESPSRKAEQSRREYLIVKLHFLDKNRTEAPSKTLGEILEAVQDIVISIGRVLSPVHNRKKNVTQALLNETELTVTGIGAGSFNVELASSLSVNMFGDSLIGDAMSELFDLVSVGSSREQLKERLEKFGITVSTKYYKLLSSISTSKINDTYLDWGSPKSGRGGLARMSSPVVIETLDILAKWEHRETRDFEVVGILTGLFIYSRNFQITVMENNKERRYTGNISKEIDEEENEFITTATMKQSYRASIREILITKVATGEVKQQILLLRLRLLNN